MHTLLDESMRPESEPDQPYEPGKDVASIAVAADLPIIFEVFFRPDQTFGFRYSAWVAWRDAWGNVRSHDWWQAQPRASIVGSVFEAQVIAMEFAFWHGVSVNDAWAPPANKSFNPTR